VAALVFLFFLLVGRMQKLSDVNHRSSFFRWECDRQAKAF
jgi:hypothetical protein